MTQARIPASVVLSLGVHTAALAAFGFLMHEAPKQAAKVVEGVDLLIQAPKPRLPPGESAPKPKPLSTMDFLKLAIPTRPHAAAPAQLSIKLQEHKTALAAAPKLEERKKDFAPKLEALNLSDRPVEAAKLDVKINRRQAAATLAALPRLEDVGRKRVRNLPEALALEDSRREAVAAGVPAMALKAPSRREALAAVSALQEAAPSSERSAPSRGLGSLLPERPLLTEARPQAAPRLAAVSEAAPKPQRRQTEQAQAVQKKGIDIEGPLADRKISSYAVPTFPAWAKAQGILEADVAIRFTVDEEGNVMSGMRVTSTSGYGRIDKLAMDSLANWRFAPKPGAGVQWGVITFRFLLE
jgi:TonB family protein